MPRRTDYTRPSDAPQTSTDNPLTGKHVLVSPHRTKRPWNVSRMLYLHSVSLRLGGYSASDVDRGWARAEWWWEQAGRCRGGGGGAFSVNAPRPSLRRSARLAADGDGYMPTHTPAHRANTPHRDRPRSQSRSACRPTTQSATCAPATTVSADTRTLTMSTPT